MSARTGGGPRRPQQEGASREQMSQHRDAGSEERLYFSAGGPSVRESWSVLCKQSFGHSAAFCPFRDLNRGVTQARRLRLHLKGLPVPFLQSSVVRELEFELGKEERPIPDGDRGS